MTLVTLLVLVLLCAILIQVRIKAPVKVSVGVWFGSEICKLHIHHFRIAQCILQIAHKLTDHVQHRKTLCRCVGFGYLLRV